jgi:hypothetical protein
MEAEWWICSCYSDAETAARPLPCRANTWWLNKGDFLFYHQSACVLALLHKKSQNKRSDNGRNSSSLPCSNDTVPPPRGGQSYKFHRLASLMTWCPRLSGNTHSCSASCPFSRRRRSSSISSIFKNQERSNKSCCPPNLFHPNHMDSNG